MNEFKTETFIVPRDLSLSFSKNLDGNPVHLEGHSNEVLPTGTSSGLFVVALCSKSLLQVPGYQDVLVAKEISIKWLKPVFVDDRLFMRGSFQEKPHPKRPGMKIRTTECRVFRESELEAEVIRYQIVQLLRA